jgi:hypothetical protein
MLLRQSMIALEVVLLVMFLFVEKSLAMIVPNSLLHRRELEALASFQAEAEPVDVGIHRGITHCSLRWFAACV